MNIVRAPWTNSSFLLYLGGLTVLSAVVSLLAVLSGDYGRSAFAGWSALVLAILVAFAFSFRRAGQPLVAGLFAVSAVAAFAFFLGALEDWLGWLPDDSHDFSFRGFHVGLLVLELLTLVAALVAIRVFRFPLLVAAAAGVGWLFATDLLSGGGNWSAVVTIAVGVVLLLVALAVDRGRSRGYGLWLHVVAGLTIGGGLLWFWHSSDTDWILVAIAGLAYIGVADRVMRSSWAVLGAWGLLESTGHFVEKWTSSTDFFLSFFLFPFSFSGDGYGEARREWAGPISFGVLGLAFVTLGLLLARGRRALPPAEAV